MPSKSITGGYAQSKWVAEKLVTIARSRGLPVSIYRPGRIAGHSQTGASNKNDLMCKMIEISFQLGSVPDVDTIVNLTPVDYVSKAIVHLSRQQESLGKAFHLLNPKPLNWADLVNWLRSSGYTFKFSSYAEWRTALKNSNGSVGGDLSLMRFLYESEFRKIDWTENRKELPAVRLDYSHTLEGLAGSGVV